MKLVNYANFSGYVEADAIRSMYLVPFPMAKGYAIWGETANGIELCLETTRREQRRFASADTALETIRGMGWKRPVLVHTE